MKVDTDAPGIAIMCNAWAELDQDIHRHSCQISLDLIDKKKSIESVLLAATHVNLTPLNQGKNLWFDNSYQIFVEQQGVDWVRRLWRTAAEKQNTDNTCFTHNALIRDHDFQGRPCIAIWEQWQLEWLLNHYFAHIQNVWYFGAGLGVRRDPFGWGQLCDLIKHNHVRSLNILTHPLGMLNNTQNAPKVAQTDFEYIDWSEVDGWTIIDSDSVVKTDLEW